MVGRIDEVGDDPRLPRPAEPEPQPSCVSCPWWHQTEPEYVHSWGECRVAKDGPANGPIGVDADGGGWEISTAPHFFCALHPVFVGGPHA